MHSLQSYGNENDNGYDKHLRSQTDLVYLKPNFARKINDENFFLRVHSGLIRNIP